MKMHQKHLEKGVLRQCRPEIMPKKKKYRRLSIKKRILETVFFISSLYKKKKETLTISARHNLSLSEGGVMKAKLHEQLLLIDHN